MNEKAKWADDQTPIWWVRHDFQIPKKMPTSAVEEAISIFIKYAADEEQDSK